MMVWRIKKKLKKNEKSVSILNINVGKQNLLDGLLSILNWYCEIQELKRIRSLNTLLKLFESQLSSKLDF